MGGEAALWIMGFGSRSGSLLNSLARMLAQLSASRLQCPSAQVPGEPAAEPALAPTVRAEETLASGFRVQRPSFSPPVNRAQRSMQGCRVEWFRVVLVGIVGFRCLRAVAFGFQMTSLGLFGIQTLLIVSSRSRVPPSANMAILQYIKMRLQSNLGCGPGSSRFETRVT